MVSVRGLRRQGSYRIFARPFLPLPIARIQPQAAHDVCQSDWARKLQYRTGWHCMQTSKGLVVVFLIHLARVTHYVHLPLSCNTPPQCMLFTSFDITTAVAHLGQLEAMLAGVRVKAVCELKVSCTAEVNRGICISLDGFRDITEPATPPPKVATGDVDDVDVALGSDDNEDDRDVVDTDKESGGSDEESGTSSDEEVTDEAKAMAMKKLLRLTAVTPVVHPATKPPRDRGPSNNLRPLWSDEYFIIGDHHCEAKDREFVQIRVRRPWKAGLGGFAPMTKQFRPQSFGESRDDPVRCLLLLRGWSLWRARVASGWGNERTDGRRQHFHEQEASLERDVKFLNSPCGLLGNKEANHSFVGFVPEIAARLRQAKGF